MLKKVISNGFLIGALLVPFLVLGQINFESGYFINNDQDKVSCFIKNEDWLNNPTTFTYKLSENGNIQEATISEVKEFTVFGGKSYIRKQVPIEKSPVQINNLSSERRPIFEEGVVFLRKLIDGEYSLYGYTEASKQLFFLETSSGEILPLVFKKYQATPSKIGENNQFRQQLYNALECDNFDEDMFKDLRYSEKDLMEIVTAFNACNGSFVSVDDEETFSKPDRLNLLLKAGYRLHAMSVLENPVFGVEDFDTTGGIAVGLELEYIFNFKKNKWSLFSSLTYHSVSFELSKDPILPRIGYQFDYSAIDIAIGGRHSMFLGEETRLFISAGFLAPITLEGAYFVNGQKINETLSTGNGFVSAGVNYQDFYFEVAHSFKRIILDQRDGEYSNITFSIGYSLL